MIRALLAVVVLLLWSAPAFAEYTWFLGVNDGKGWRVVRVFENKWECQAEQKKREQPGLVVRCAFWRPGTTYTQPVPRERPEPQADRYKQERAAREAQRESLQEEEALRRRAERTEYCNRTFAPREREKCLKDFEPVRR